MKKILLLTFLLAGQLAWAQTQTLATDESGKYIIYQVEDIAGAKAATLYQRCLIGLKKNYKNKNFNITPLPDTLITVKGKIMVYTSQSAVRHEDGDMTYQLRIEFKDGKYRYWFSNFVFTPYQRNRYGTFEPAPGKELTFEAAKDKIGKKRFEEYADQLIKYCKQFGDNLKIYAAGPQNAPEKTKKVDTRNW